MVMVQRRVWWRMLGLCCLVLLAGSARADIYNCTVDGVKTFSETPCGADAKVIKTKGDVSVAFGPAMSTADIETFCTILMRGHDDSVANTANGTQRTPLHYDSWTGVTYGGQAYNMPSQDSTQAVQRFILSHISNLHQLAHEAPDMYHYVIQMADSHSRTGQQGVHSDTDREAELSECQQQVSNYLKRQSGH